VHKCAVFIMRSHGKTTYQRDADPAEGTRTTVGDRIGRMLCVGVSAAISASLIAWALVHFFKDIIPD